MFSGKVTRPAGQFQCGPRQNMECWGGFAWNEVLRVSAPPREKDVNTATPARLHVLGECFFHAEPRRPRRTTRAAETRPDVQVNFNVPRHAWSCLRDSLGTKSSAVPAPPRDNKVCENPYPIPATPAQRNSTTTSSDNSARRITSRLPAVRAPPRAANPRPTSRSNLS